MNRTNITPVTESPIPIEDLIAENADYRETHSKALSIIRSLSGLTSMISSSVMIWMILRSEKRLTTTLNRIVLGMGISDILYSMVFVHFNFLTPEDLSYMVWNARGNVASCAAVGYLSYLGWISGVLYCCSLNMYYVTVVKYNPTDRYIKSKIERWLHGIPIVVAVVVSTTFLLTKRINSFTDGICHSSTYANMPHCIGYKEFEIREGFSIPCERGKDTGSDSYGFGAFFFLVIFLILTVLAPIMIITCLLMLYAHVRKQEKRMERYGAGGLNLCSKTKEQREAEEKAAEISLKAKLAELKRKRMEAEASIIAQEDSAAKEEDSAAKEEDPAAKEEDSAAKEEDSAAKKCGSEEGAGKMGKKWEEELGKIKAEENAVQAALEAIHAKKLNEDENKISRNSGSTMLSKDSKDSSRFTVRSTLSSIRNSGKSLFNRHIRSSSNRERDRQGMSRNFMLQARAFSAAFFLTWVWYAIQNIYLFADPTTRTARTATAPLGLSYLLSIFNPLQGFFNLLVYMLPKVLQARRAENGISWRGAFAKAFRPGQQRQNRFKRAARK